MSPRHSLCGSLLLLLVVVTGSATRADAFACFNNGGRCVLWDPSQAHMKFLLGPVGGQLSNGTVTFDQNAELAADVWNGLGSPFQFSWEVGTQFIDPCGAQGSNHVCNNTGPVGDNPVFFSNTICGRSFGDILAQTTTCFETATSRTLNTPVFFNGTIDWDAYDGPLRPRYDIRRVITHELGHVIGLVHPDDRGQQVSALMNRVVSNLDRPQSDDINGVFNLYGGAPPTAQPTDGSCAVTSAGDGRGWWPLLLAGLLWALRFKRKL